MILFSVTLTLLDTVGCKESKVYFNFLAPVQSVEQLVIDLGCSGLGRLHVLLLLTGIWRISECGGFETSNKQPEYLCDSSKSLGGGCPVDG